MSQTENSTWDGKEWLVQSPLNISAFAEVPSVFANLKCIEPENELLSTRFNFINPTKEVAIQTLAHKTLLNDSIALYGDIWRKLAE